MTTKTDELTGVVVAAENPLKEMLLEYVGNKFATEEDEGEFEVTVQMIVDTLAHEFPAATILATTHTFATAARASSASTIAI